MNAWDRVMEEYYLVARGTEPDGGGCASSPTLQGARATARERHELDGKAYVVYRGEKVHLRIKENPDHEKPNFQVMPPLSEEEFQALKEDIAKRGLQYPIIKDAYGNTIDGHHRERALKELKAEGREVHAPPGKPHKEEVAESTVEEKRNLAWSLNMQRRHLSREQRQALIDAKLKESPEYSDRRIGDLLGVSKNTVRSRREQLESGGQVDHLEKAVGKDGKAYQRKPRSEKAKPDWSAEERNLQRRVLAGETVVVNMRKRARHHNIIAWAKNEGLFVRIDESSDSKWGNDHKPEHPGNLAEHDAAVEWYEHTHLPQSTDLIQSIPELKAKVLGCWCAGEMPCHGDVLAALANGEKAVKPAKGQVDPIPSSPAVEDEDSSDRGPGGLSDAERLAFGLFEEWDKLSGLNARDVADILKRERDPEELDSEYATCERIEGFYNELAAALRS